MKIKDKYYNKLKHFGKLMIFALDHLNYSMAEVEDYGYLTTNEKKLISEKLFYKYFTQI